MTNNRITELAKKITSYNVAYRDGVRLITDAEYDAMLEELRKLDPSNQLCTEIQPDTNVSVGLKGKFNYGNDPMLSLNKVYTIEALIKWMNSVARSPQEVFLLQPKYDGLSGCIDSDAKVLATRGNGEVGEVINAKIPMIKIDSWSCGSNFTGYSNEFSFSEVGRTRGEIIIHKDIFKELQVALNRKDGTIYKNARNCVSGLTNSMMSESDNATVIKNLKENNLHISFVPHDAIFTEIRIADGNLAEKIEKVWDSYLKQLPYEQDGLVIKLADTEYSNSLGNTSHHPRGAVALKRNAAGIPCQIESISWFVGMGYELTPVYNITKTEIDGVEISNVLGHNMKNLQDNDVSIGSTAFVLRSGGVIPYASNYESNPDVDNKNWKNHIGLTINKETNKWQCPCCNSDIIYNPDKSPDAFCSNEHCHDAVMKRLYNASSKCFEIKGLAEETLTKINNMFGTEKFYQLFDISQAQFATLPGFAPRSAEILFDSIQSARQCTDIKVLASLGIPMIGRSVAKDLLTIMTLDTLRSISTDDLIQIKGFGPEKSKSLVTGLLQYSEELDELLRRVELKQSFSATKKAEATGNPTICFTGASPISRSECQTLAKANGYEPVSGVNKNLAILVCADADSQSSKAKKARSYGTEILSFDDWYKSLTNKGQLTEQEEIAPNVADVFAEL